MDTKNRCFRPQKSPAPDSKLCLLRGGLLYLALWGGLCSMASLSRTGLLPLAVGGLFVLGAALVPKKGPWLALLWGGGLLLIGGLLLTGGSDTLDGLRLLLNRLCAASESRQAYTYEMFSISAPQSGWTGCMRRALALLGLLTGLLLGTAARYGQRWAAGICFCAFVGAAAYLGVSPTARWLCLLSAAAALWLLEPGRTGQFAFLLRAGGVTLAAVGLFALVWALSPVENPALSAWEEHARDVLAQDSVAYADQAALQQTSTPEPTENPQPVQEEDAALDVGGEDAPWLRPLRAGLLIVLFALLLFVPSLLSDWQKRRRARNRAGLNSPDCAAAVRAAFLYAMRWLTVGGLSPENCPYSGYAPQIAQRFSPQLCTQFQAALPLWQEAAYSDHPMTQNQRGQMLSFSTLAQQTVWEQLDRKGRFLAKYVYAL